MRLGTAIMICTLALACLVQPAVAQRVDLHLSTDSLTVGDRVLLTLVAMHRLDRQPEFPAIANDSVFGDLHVLGLQSEGVRYGADGSRIDSVVYEATTFELDTVRIPPIPVAFEGGAFYRESAPVEIYVTSLVSESDTVILGMTDPVGFGRPVWPFVLLGLALVLCVALAVYLVRRSRAPKVIAPSIGPPVRAPHELALARLRALENAPLVRRAHVEAFFVELSDALRTYLEHRLDLPALESTTEELVEDLLGPAVQHRLPGGIPQEVRQVLVLADLVKFADFTPPNDESRDSVGKAVGIIEDIESKQAQIEARELMVKPS